MLTLTTHMQKKYIIVTIGIMVFKNDTLYIKCVLCGNLCSGITQQDQIDGLFKCLGTHIPKQDLFEIYEQHNRKIITSINREVWDKAQRRTKSQNG